MNMSRLAGLLLFVGCMASAAPKTTAPETEAKTTTTAAVTGPTFAFQFRNAEMVDVIQSYSKVTGQKFVIDGGIHGKVTIMNPRKVTSEEAFNLLSLALASASVAISVQGDTMLVMQARQIQRNMIPVVTELPAAKPERMVAWVVDMQNIDADEVNRQLRLLTSKDGEVMSFGRNKLIIQDFISNLYRVHDIIAQIDKPGYQAPKDRVVLKKTGADEKQ